MPDILPCKHPSTQPAVGLASLPNHTVIHFKTNKMKKISVLLSCFLVFLAACNNSAQNEKQDVAKEKTVDQTEEFTDQDAKSTFDKTNAIVVNPSDITPVQPVEKTKAGKSLFLITFTTEEKRDCPKLPTAISQLNSGAGFKIFKFDQQSSAGAKALGFEGSIERKQMVLVQDYTRYTIIDCNGTKKKIGIGLRCIIHVVSRKGKVGYTSLTGIAANVELGKAKATYELYSLGFGMDGSVIAEGLNPQGDYTVENFGKLAVTFNNVLKTLNNSSKMIINPVELPQ